MRHQFGFDLHPVQDDPISHANLVGKWLALQILAKEDELKNYSDRQLLGWIKEKMTEAARISPEQMEKHRYSSYIDGWE
jgi:hypothetical protein